MSVATAAERCFDLMLPAWQPPRRCGLVALVGPDASARWADRLLARHGDGFVMWTAAGAQPAAQAMAVARLPQVRAVVIAPAAVDVRHAGLALEFAGRMGVVRGRSGSDGCVTSPAKPMLPEEAVRVPHLVSVRHRGAVTDAVVWELMLREEMAGWLGWPLPEQRFFERHLVELLRLRAAARVGRFPLSAGGRQLARLVGGRELSIEMVYRNPELFGGLLVAQLAGRRS